MLWSKLASKVFWLRPKPSLPLARGLGFNFRATPVNDGVPPGQIARFDIVMRFA